MTVFISLYSLVTTRMSWNKEKQQTNLFFFQNAPLVNLVYTVYRTVMTNVNLVNAIKLMGHARVRLDTLEVTVVMVWIPISNQASKYRNLRLHLMWCRAYIYSHSFKNKIRLLIDDITKYTGLRRQRQTWLKHSGQRACKVYHNTYNWYFFILCSKS